MTTYISGHYGFAIASHTVDALADMSPALRSDYEAKGLQAGMHYYSPEVHAAAFALPEFARRELGAATGV